MEAATLAASIMPVNGPRSTGNLGTKSSLKAVKGGFANLLLTLQGYAPAEAQSSSGTTTADSTGKTGEDASNSLLQALIGQLQGSSGTTTTDSTDKAGKDSSNSLLQALIQLLSGQLQGSSGTTTADSTGKTGEDASNSLLQALIQAAGDLQDSGGSGAMPATVANLPSLINQALDSLPASGNAGQVDQGLLADLTALSQALQGDQAGTGKTGATTTDGAVTANGQSAKLLAAVKTDLSQADPVVPESGTGTSASTGVLPRAPDETTASSQTVSKTVANLPTVGSDLKNSSTSTAAQSTVDDRTLPKTIQTPGDLGQSGQDSGSSGHSRETQVKDASFVKLETQQPQESSPQSSSSPDEVNGLLAQSSAQQNDLSSATGLGQTANSASPTLGDSVFSQIVASATLAVNNNNASMRIQLKPEFLGDLKLVVDVEQGVLNAHFITQNQVTASLIQARLPELKQALNDQGISWQHLTVSSEAGQSNHQGASSQSQQNTGQSQTQTDYVYDDSSDSNAPSTTPAIYQWADTGSFNYVV